MAPLLALGLSALALAGHPGYGRAAVGTVQIHNHFAGEAAVYVGGRYFAHVEGCSSVHVQLRPGRHRIEVRRPQTGFPLATRDVRVHPRQPVLLDVVAPITPLTLRNEGPVPVRFLAEGVATSPAGSGWVPPGGALTLDVTAGDVSVRALMQDPRGDAVVLEQRVWAEPGQRTLEVLRPRPASLRLTNGERMPVRVLVDQRDTGIVLRPGATRELFLRPGAARVTLVDLRGRTRLVNPLTLRAARAHSLVLQRTGRPVVHVSAAVPAGRRAPPRHRR